MDQIDLMSKRPVRNPKLKFRLYKHKAVIFPAYGLNETGTEIFLLCNGEKTVMEIIDILANKYKESKEYITEAVVSFLKKLHDLKIIDICG
jgi:hypothetical protein